MDEMMMYFTAPEKKAKLHVTSIEDIKRELKISDKTATELIEKVNFNYWWQGKTYLRPKKLWTIDGDPCYTGKSIKQFYLNSILDFYYGNKRFFPDVVTFLLKNAEMQVLIDFNKMRIR